MTRHIEIVDTTFRDAHQSLWATRMTTPMMLSVAEAMDNMGFNAMDFIGLAQFDACVRYLRENPWERIRLIRRKTTKTPLQAGLRTRSLAKFDIVPQDIIELWIERLVANGIQQISAWDALYDMQTIEDIIALLKEAGVEIVAKIVFSISPVHTDSLFVEHAKQLVQQGVDRLVLKDPSGLLTPERVRTLVPALREVCGNLPLEIHSHCSTGLAPLVYLDAVKLGVDRIHTSIAPLANGPAQPAMQTMVKSLRAIGYEVNINDRLMHEVSTYFARVAEQEGKPVGVPMEYDPEHYSHQLPGGMLTNLQFQLQQIGIGEKYDEVLKEIVRVRSDLGWPAMVTPFSQLVATQAVFNITHNERYACVADEVKKYALGYYGKLLAPIPDDVMDRIISNGSPHIPLTPVPPEPAVATLRSKYPGMDDEERLLRYVFSSSDIDAVMQADTIPEQYQVYNTPLGRAIHRLVRTPGFETLVLEDDDTLISISL